MSIANNVASINAQRSLGKAAGALQGSMAKLSSGARITKAGDDAAGLAISEKLRGEVRGLNQAARNGEDAISMVQTAEGALEEVHSMLQRIRELAVQGSNDTLDDTDREFINTEMKELREQINSVSSDTEFNGKKLASGNLSSSLDKATSTVELGLALAAASVTNIDVSGAENNTTYTFSDTANGLTLTSSGGISQEVLDANLVVAANGERVINFSELGVSVTVASALGETAANVSAQLANGSKTIVTNNNVNGGSAVFHTGADKDQTITVAFKDVRVDGANADARMQALDTALDAFETSTASRAEAEQIIEDADQAIEYISETRAGYGAKQNRLESAVNNLMQSAENLTAAESRIRDVDVAAESANMAKAQVLQQAAVSVLAQANQQPNLALKLLS
jgi:flagellin